MADDAPVVKRTLAKTTVVVVGWALAAVLAAVQGWGYLTPEQVQQIQTTVQQHQQSAVSPPVAEQPVKGMSQAEMDVFLKDVAERLKPAVEPTPALEVVAVDPKPEPAKPKPAKPTTALKINITDEAGKPVTAGEAQPGQLLMVTASAKARVAWSAAKHGDVRLLVLPDNAGYAFSLQVGSDIQFFLTDSSLKTTNVLMVCGARPPPVVVVPQPVIPPVPVTPPVVVPVPPPVVVPVTPPVVVVPEPVKPVVPLIDDPTGLMKASHAGKMLVNSPQRHQQALKIAKAHRDAAKAFLANSDPFSLVAVMEKETTAGIKAALSPQEMTLWVPWAEAVAVQMNDLQVSGAITTREEWVDAYTAIAAGLEVEP